MVLLTKDITLFNRDEKGELIPDKVTVVVDDSDDEELEYKDIEIRIIPITRGEMKKLFSETQEDLQGTIIEKYMYEPKYSAEEITLLKPVFARILSNTILHESGLKLKSSLNNVKNAPELADKKETEFSKN